MTKLYRDRRFATYWTGQAVSELGDRISELALPLIAITTLGASSIEVGVLTAAVWAPQLLSLFMGAWVDQQPHKRRLLIASDVLQGLAVATLPLVWWLGSLTLVQLVAVALVAGVGRTISQTAYAPFFASLVTRDQYVEANSLLSITRSGSFVVGPALGGALIQALGAPVAMVVDAVSFAFSAHMIGRVRVTERPPAEHSETLVRRAVQGFSYLWRHPYMAASLRCCTTLNFFGFVAAALVVLYASRSLGLPAGAIGLAFGVGAVGGLVGAVLAGRIARRIGTGYAIAVGAVLFSAPYALVPLAPARTRRGRGAGSGRSDRRARDHAVRHQPQRPADGRRARRHAKPCLRGVLHGQLRHPPVRRPRRRRARQPGRVGPTLVAAAAGGTLSVVWLARSPILRTKAIDDLQPVA